MAGNPLHRVDDPDSAGSSFYRTALQKLIDANIPFLVGGAYALQAHTGIVRRTKDFDIFMLRQDVARTLEILHSAGYQTELTFPHWIAKVFSGEDFIDIIFSSGNGVGVVDPVWFEHAVAGSVLGMPLKLCPAEETIWQKAFILERDRCDVADVAHLIRHRGVSLDWQRLLERFAQRWHVLLAQLVLFDFIYPGHVAAIPAWVRKDLTKRWQQNENLQSESRENVTDRTSNESLALNAECHGTYLSATQYLRDIDTEGYRDGRLQPLGTMTPDDVAVWTANFMKPKS